MRNELVGDKLTIFLEGEVNSFVADDVEKEIEHALKKNEYKSVVLDMSNLVYMSSAGLRIVMRVKQKCDDVTLANMPDSVYDVFNMVGLTEVFKITRLNK